MRIKQISGNKFENKINLRVEEISKKSQVYGCTYAVGNKIWLVEAWGTLMNLMSWDSSAAVLALCWRKPAVTFQWVNSEDEGRSSTPEHNLEQTYTSAKRHPESLLAPNFHGLRCSIHTRYHNHLDCTFVSTNSPKHCIFLFWSVTFMMS